MEENKTCNSIPIFKNYLFTFVGFKNKLEREIIEQLVEEKLGANNRNEEKLKLYIIIDDENYNGYIDNLQNYPVYKKNYIRDSIAAGAALDIDAYRVNLTKSSDSQITSSETEIKEEVIDLSQDEAMNCSDNNTPKNETIVKKEIDIKKESEVNKEEIFSDSEVSSEAILIDDTSESDDDIDSNCENDDHEQADNVKTEKPEKSHKSKKICKFPNCTLEPSPHIRHCIIQRNFSKREEKLMLKYLIKNRCINKTAKSQETWRKMQSDGFLKHRTPISLRNRFNIYILPNIDKFKLSDKTKKKFKKLIVTDNTSLKNNL